MKLNTQEQEIDYLSRTNEEECYFQTKHKTILVFSKKQHLLTHITRNTKQE